MNNILHLQKVLVEHTVYHLSTMLFFYLAELFMIVSCFRIHCCQLLHELFWIILYIWVNWQAEVFSISSYTKYQLMQPVIWSNLLGKSYTGSKASFWNDSSWLILHIMIKNLLPAEFSKKKTIPSPRRDCISAYGNNK